MKKDTARLQIHPEVFIIAILVLAPLIGGRREFVGTGALAILALGSVAALLWTNHLRRPIGLWPFAAFVLLLGASAIVTASMHVTIYQTLFFASCGALALVASSAFRENRWFVAANIAIVASSAILAISGINEYSHSARDWRIFGPFESPGYLGGYLVLAIPVVLGFLLAVRSTVVKASMTVLWGLCIAALFLTGTRFAIISVGIAGLSFILLALWAKCLDKIRLVWLGIAVLVAIGAAGIASAPTATRVQGKAATEQSHSLPFRVATWKGTVNVVKSHPLLGTGAGTFELVFPRYMVAGYTRMAHNGYLQIASESGIPALLAAIIAFGALFIAGIRGLRNDENDASGIIGSKGSTLLACALAAALVGSLARNLMDSDIYNPAIGFTFWAFAGMIASRAPVRKTFNQSTAIRLGVTLLLVVMSAIWYSFMLGESHSTSAETAMANGDVQTSIEDLRSATSVDPLQGDYWLRLGQLEALTENDESQWQQGIGYIKKAASLEPTRARNYIILGRFLESHKDDQSAIAEYKRALWADPHATPAMLESARLMTGNDADLMYQRLVGEEKSPVEQLKGVPELVNPDFAWAHYYFGQKYAKAEQWQDASDQFGAVIERLERRKSYKLFQAAAKEAGMLNPEEESALDTLLSDAKAGLANAKAHLTNSGGHK